MPRLSKKLVPVVPFRDTHPVAIQVGQTIWMLDNLNYQQVFHQQLATFSISETHVSAFVCIYILLYGHVYNTHLYAYIYIHHISVFGTT